MAKVTGPLFSFSASGQLGKSLVYAVWKGICYVRKYVSAGVSNEDGASVEQQTIRGYFSTSVTAYQALTSQNKALWEDYAQTLGSPQSGFNAFVGKYVLYLIDNAGVPPTGPYLPPS